MNRFVILAMCAIATVGFMPGAAAHTVTGSYTIATTPGLSVVCSPDCIIQDLNIGGYTFPNSTEEPIKVEIFDVSGGDVAYTVCQDWDGALCGEVGEPRVVGCGSVVDLTTSVVKFRNQTDVSVFIRLVDTACPTSQASSGSIALTYRDLLPGQ